MGYRNYLYKIPKKEIKKLRSITLEELVEKYGDKEEDYVSMLDVLEHKSKCIFEYGKLYWDDTIERIHATGEKLFTNEEIDDRFSDYDVYLVGKKALEETINIYKGKIVKMYEHLLDNKDLTDKDIIDKYEEHLKDYRIWWTRFNALNLDENNDCICDSWLYEHKIFELVRLYKTIDFEEYDLLFLGW